MHFKTIHQSCLILTLDLVSLLDHRHDPCQQRVYLEEEDVELIFTGYRFVRSRVYLYYLLCLLSCGIIFLLGRWLPRRYIAFVAQKCEMSKAECIVVQVCPRRCTVIRLDSNPLACSLSAGYNRLIHVLSGVILCSHFLSFFHTYYRTNTGNSQRKRSSPNTTEVQLILFSVQDKWRSRRAMIPMMKQW